MSVYKDGKVPKVGDTVHEYSHLCGVDFTVIGRLRRICLDTEADGVLAGGKKIKRYKGQEVEEPFGKDEEWIVNLNECSLVQRGM